MMPSKRRPSYAPRRRLVVLGMFIIAAIYTTRGPYGGENGNTRNPFSGILSSLNSFGLQAPDTKASAPLHGWVSKAGPVSLIEWYGDLKPARIEIFRLWFERYKQTKTEKNGKPWMYDMPHIMFPRCHIFVNHEYKYIYVKSMKTGSTSLQNFFTECDRPNPGVACWRMLPMDTPKEDVAKYFATYFVFTVARNPYSRALSSYKYLLDRTRADPAVCVQGITWNGFCQDPVSLGQRCSQRPDCCWGVPGFYWEHVSEQARCILAGPEEERGSQVWNASAAGEGQGIPGPRWAVDFIARMEFMEEDMQVILQEIDRRRDPGLPALSNPSSSNSTTGVGKANAVPSCKSGGERLKPTMKMRVDGPYLAAVPQEQYCEVREYFQGQHAQCAAAIQHFYQRDLEILGYLPLTKDPNAAGLVPT